MLIQIYVSLNALKDPRFNKPELLVNIFNNAHKMSNNNLTKLSNLELTADEKQSLDTFFWDNYDPVDAPSEMLEELEKLIDASYANETYEVDAIDLIKLWHKFNPKDTKLKTIYDEIADCEKDTEID